MSKVCELVVTRVTFICFCPRAALQIRSRSSSRPSRATQVVSGPAVKQHQTPPAGTEDQDHSPPRPRHLHPRPL
ncbi:hypothetical protein VZT92_017957 [Zoarces viviparus]|uniref:Secreted protein n=1 Tax=Zoarces viviparus TaxID=48416 RepID=A0AAW1ENC5_ZOAVI